MDLDAVKRSLSGPPERSATTYPPGFYDALILHPLRVDTVEPGRILCSFTIPPNLANSDGVVYGAVMATLVDVVGSAVFVTAGHPTTGVSLDIGISYFDTAAIGEEIEIEAKLLDAKKAVGVTSVDIRKKGTKKLLAQGRHSKYLAVSSRL